MSTFSGFVSEFPLIRIDGFRNVPGKPPPLACFLSHVHSDHLAGLESLRSPFVYCSAATREMLLRMERHPHRINLANGILERRVQTYKHLDKLLKPLPIDTPTRIELSPGNAITVTLFEANHCLGAVMFLVEGQGKAILYTGDIRAEPWWIEALVRKPTLIKYSTAQYQLDKVYLDTTFAASSDPYRNFQTKADGVRELIQKLQEYPPETVYYFRSWTFGYEDVWIALGDHFGCQVHLDAYRYKVYNRVKGSNGHLSSSEASALCGFHCGNWYVQGIITVDPSSKIHSCERGTGCFAPDSSDTIHIVPVVARQHGFDLHELGIRGGRSDLARVPELDLSDSAEVNSLLKLCSADIADESDLEKIEDLLRALTGNEGGSLELDGSLIGEEHLHSLSLHKLAALVKKIALAQDTRSTERLMVASTSTTENTSEEKHPRTITFPYSRHSSYDELCAFLAKFRPRDVWPCTAPPTQSWNDAINMRSLFGHVCEVGSSGYDFDNSMMHTHEKALPSKRRHDDLASISSSRSGPEGQFKAPAATKREHDIAFMAPARTFAETDVPSTTIAMHLPKRKKGKAQRLSAREEAFEAAKQGDWHHISLTSTKADRVEDEF